MEDGTAWPFQIADAGIAIHAYNEDVAFATGAFEISNVSDVQRIKAAVGKDDAPSVPLVFRELLAQNISSDDFGGGLAHNLRGGSGCLATDGIEKFLARDGSGAAFHYYEAAGDVSDVRGFERRCPAGERQGVRGENGVAGAGDVHSLVAAVNGNLREAITRFEKSCAVPSAGDQKRLQFHFRKSCTACPRELASILTDGRVIFSLKLSLVWRRGSNARLRISMQLIARVKGNGQCALALGRCLLDKLRSRYAKAIVGNSERVRMAQISQKPLMELFSNGVGKRGFRFVIDPQNVLSDAVRKELHQRLLADLRHAHALAVSDYGFGIATPDLVQQASARRKGALPVTLDARYQLHRYAKAGITSATPNEA